MEIMAQQMAEHGFEHLINAAGWNVLVRGETDGRTDGRTYVTASELTMHAVAHRSQVRGNV